MNENEKIGLRIKQEMDRLKWSYAEFESHCGVSRSTINRYVTNTTKAIPMDKLGKIAKGLGVSTAYLMGWEEKPIPDAADQSEQVKARSQYFADMIKRRMASINITIDELCGNDLDKTKMQAFLDGKLYEPAILKMETIAKRLQVTPSYLFGWQVGEVSPEEATLIGQARDAFMQLTESEKRYAIKSMQLQLEMRPPAEPSSEHLFDNNSLSHQAK